MMMRFTTLLALLALTIPAQAAVPDTLHYQGYLTNAVGDPVHCPDALACPDETFDLTFRLYDSAEGGDPLWEETHAAVPIVRGTFDVELGSQSPVDPAKLADPTWLGLAVNGGGEMAPRQRLVSAAFALRSQAAETAELADDSDRLGGVDAQEYALLSDLPGMCVTDSELQEVLAEEAYLDAGALAVYLTDSGYVPGPHFSGQFADLEGVPAALQKLSLTTEGSLAFGDTIIINAAGEWVGAATGLQGPPGEDGTPGEPGEPGAPGAPGDSGLTAFVETTAEPAGDSCASGGVKISSGHDTDGSGGLEGDEVQSVSYVCHGTAGSGEAPGGSAVLAPASGPPQLCTSAVKDVRYFDTTLGAPRICDGALWVPVYNTECGNGTLQAGEECDAPFGFPNEGCEQCTLLGPSYCTGACDIETTRVLHHPHPMIVADDGNEQEYFGESIALNGDTLAIGSPRSELFGLERAGAVYVFVRSGGEWVQEQKLTASFPAVGDRFGQSVAISGETLVVGSIYDDDNGVSGSGSVYVYVRSEGEWTLEQKLTSSTPGQNHYFGKTVSISGDTLVAAGSDTAGVLDVFTRIPGAWTLQQTLTAADVGDPYRFATAITVAGDSLAVGAQDVFTTSPGSVYVYARNNGSWSLEQKLFALDAVGGGNDSFGRRLAFGEDSLFVAAAVGANVASSQGLVYLYERQANTWSLAETLTASDGGSGDVFGSDFGVDGDTLVVGAKNDDNKGVNNNGAAYVFSRVAGAWVEQEKIHGPDGIQSYDFGASVAISADTVAFGVHRHEHNGLYSGAVYVFTPEPYCSTDGACICDPGYGGDDCGTELP